LRAARTYHEQLASCLSKITVKEADLSLAQTGRDDAERLFALAEAEHSAAAAALQDARDAHAVAGLAEKLVLGEPCPVCLQTVAVLPAHHESQTAAKAAAEEKTKKKSLEGARGSLSEARLAARGIEATIGELHAQRGELLAKTSTYPDAIHLLATIADADDKTQVLERARRAEVAAIDALHDKQRVLTALADATSQFQRQYGRQRDGVAALAPPPAEGTLLADWETLADWAVEQADEQRTRAELASEEADRRRVEAEGLTQELIRRCSGLDVEVEGNDHVAVLTALAAARTRAKSEVERIDRAVEEAQHLTKQIGKLAEDAEVAAMLRQKLRANEFPEWLLKEALELLVHDASSTLRELTNDGFSLTLGDNEFMVIDHANADEMRSARTLSGGETFQASLALAMALSDQIRALAADGAPRLDALFLDEGFGTLDADTLETVAATIENLGQSGRMVGIITHIRELAARVPVRFEISKGPRTSTVERVIL
jgi:DNA repair protein SbcC/Rad50